MTLGEIAGIKVGTTPLLLKALTTRWAFLMPTGTHRTAAGSCRSSSVGVGEVGVGAEKATETDKKKAASVEKCILKE